VRHVIFYSWQSDLEPALTREFIEDALRAAATNLKGDEKVKIEAVVDRDTVGVVGTPGIAETILQKIDECDVFVCDVSIINSSEEVSKANFLVQLVRAVAHVILERTFKYRRIKRLAPNPNVLIELGYAAGRIGWDRIILLQNTAYGDPGTLPFDLRNRRTIPFNLSAKETRPDEKQQLRNELEGALRKALTDMLAPAFWKAGRRTRWFGRWTTDSGPTRGATLFIREVGATGFTFHLGLYDGARRGRIEGFAGFTGPDSAYALISAVGDGEPCELKFRRLAGEPRQIRIEEGRGCQHFKGMGASFDGIYSGRRELLFDSGTLDEMDLQRLYSITGKYFWPLTARFQQVGQHENLDPFPATVAWGGAKGLYTLFEAIVIKGSEGQLWAAYVDSGSDMTTVMTKRIGAAKQMFQAGRAGSSDPAQGDFPGLPPTVVRYFTTQDEYKKHLPKTIEKWRERFSDKKVIFEHEIDTISSLD
jgi:hypothetical protein